MAATTTSGVVQEAVHWPDIPMSAIANAKALQQIASNASDRGALAAKLPVPVSDDNYEVTIRHASTAYAQPAPFASFDVVVGEGRNQRVRHFDRDGRELIHPSVRARQPDSPGK
jgi:hypothetical protein